MKSRLFSAMLLPAVFTLCISCATITYPFASPEEVALKQELTQALGEYTQTMTITVSGGRVYLGGELRNKAELDAALVIVNSAKGVTSVMEDVFLTEVGPQGPGASFE